jgi:hypothetical protein
LLGVGRVLVAPLPGYRMGFMLKKADCPVRGTSSSATNATRSIRQERQTECKTTDRISGRLGPTALLSEF